MLYESEGYEIKKNAKLPPISVNNKRKSREIDVLLTTYILGEPNHTIIQCKNEKGKIGIEKIDEFVGFLHDIGISPQQGIFICVNGFTKDALMRAEDAGIKTFTLKGLTADRLAKAVEKAFQYLVYLVPEITQITVVNKIAPKDAPNAITFVYKNKDYAGNLIDLLVNQWRQGKISNDLTEYEIELKVPQGWYQIVNKNPKRTNSINIKFRVVGHIIEITGKAEEFSITDAKSKTIKKLIVNSSFESLSKKKRFCIKKIFSESQLKEVIKSESKLQIINKMRLPRVLYNNIYHPLSKRIWDILKAKTQGLSNNQIRSLAASINFEGVEGNDPIASAHEKPFFPFPVLVEDNQKNIIDIRLVMKNRKYREVLSFKTQFENNPTPEFAQLLAIASEEIRKEILGFK